MAPEVSIVVPAYNHSDLTQQCLASLYECTSTGNYELIVVDNGSTDNTRDVLSSMSAGNSLTVLCNEDNVGFGNACNQGAAAAHGRYITFFSNDVLARPGWLAPLIAAMEEDPRRGAAQPRLLYPDGTLNDAGGLVFAGGHAWVYGKRSPFPYAPEYSCRRAPDYASGACLLVRAEAFRQVGGFDPRYSPSYYEDVDLSFSLRQAGWTVLYEPASTVVHIEGATNGTDTSGGTKAYQVRNHDLFAEKWQDELAARPQSCPSIVERWAHRPQAGDGPGEVGGGRRPKSVLVVDVVPPMYDRAAGSLRAFQIVRSLRANGHSVTYYAAGAAFERARYGAVLSRIGVPLYGRDPAETASLQGAPASAIQAWSGQFAPDITDLCQRRGYDVVVFTPWTTAEALLPQLKAAMPNVTLVVDSIDLCFLREEREAGLHPETDEQRSARLGRARRELAVYQSADKVVCVSALEAELLRHQLPGCEVTVIGIAQDELPVGPEFDRREHLLMVANANHTPNVDGLAWFGGEVVPLLAELLPEVHLTVIGNDPVGAMSRLANERVQVLGWVADTLPYLHAARLAIAPLRYGAGVKGKVLEALSSGLPVVGTSTSIEGTELFPGRDVLVADDPEQFAHAIVAAYQDKELWSALRDNGRSVVNRSAGMRQMTEDVASLIGEGPANVPAPWTSPFAAIRTGPSLTASPGAGSLPTQTKTPRANGRRKPKTSRVTAKGAHPNRPVPDGKVLLSACLIVKDEEKTLGDCLHSLNRLVDEVVVYDTGSTDSTVALARKKGAKVILGHWDDDFSRARNAALDHCHGEWVLWIDADERFSCGDPRDLRGALEGLKKYDALLVEIQNLMGDGSQMGNLHRAFRLFRRSTCQWHGALHEQVDLRPGIDGVVRAAPLEGAHILHLGYMDEVVKERDKLARNLRLAEAELARGTVTRDGEGVAELNLGRCLSALGRYQDAQPYFDVAVAKTRAGAPRRSALLYAVHNLSGLNRQADALETAKALEEVSQKKGLARYLQGAALRRLGRPLEAVQLLEELGAVDNEDGFGLPDFIMRAELAGALLELGRTGEAADQLVRVIQQNPDIRHISAAFRIFALTGKSVEALIESMPEDRMDQVAAALVIVPPVVAGQMAEGLWDRFGPKPQLLAAAIKFGPLLPTERALDWSARLRAIGMSQPCPLIVQAALPVLQPVVRLRAAVTAHAAFADPRGKEMALAIISGVASEHLPSALAEVRLLDPSLVDCLAEAAALAGANGLGAGSAEERKTVVDQVMVGFNTRDLVPGPWQTDLAVAEIGPS